MSWIAESVPPHRLCTARRVADVLPEAHRRADWRAVRALFRQLLQFAEHDRERIPAELTEAFALELREASSCSGYVRPGEQSCEHALAILAEVEGHETLDVAVYRRYYEDDRFTGPPSKDTTLVRRRSAPFEAVVETARRIRDANQLREALRNTESSGLPAGSTVYGGFYNVRGNRRGQPASDLDIIVAVGDAQQLPAATEALSTLPGVRPADVDRFARRCRVFADSLDDGRTVLSHKITLWGDGSADPMLPGEVARAEYLLSLHFVTPTVLDYILVASTPRLLQEVAGNHRSVRDYRESPARRHDHVRTLTGRSYLLGLDTRPAECGFLRSTRVYYIDESDHYCPGFFQTMFLPQPEPLWDSLDVRPALQTFYRTLAERVLYERGKHPHTMILPSFAHVRRDAFAPQVIKKLDGVPRV